MLALDPGELIDRSSGGRSRRDERRGDGGVKPGSESERNENKLRRHSFEDEFSGCPNVSSKRSFAFRLRVRRRTTAQRRGSSGAARGAATSRWRLVEGSERRGPLALRERVSVIALQLDTVKRALRQALRNHTQHVREDRVHEDTGHPFHGRNGPFHSALHRRYSRSQQGENVSNATPPSRSSYSPPSHHRKSIIVHSTGVKLLANTAYFGRYRLNQLYTVCILWCYYNCSCTRKQKICLRKAS